jgi:hypothetical protein
MVKNTEHIEIFPFAELEFMGAVEVVIELDSDDQ